MASCGSGDWSGGKDENGCGWLGEGGFGEVRINGNWGKPKRGKEECERCLVKKVKGLSGFGLKGRGH